MNKDWLNPKYGRGIYRVNTSLASSYSQALRRGIPFELYDYHKKKEINLFFNWLGPIYENWVDERSFYMLEIPFFKPFYLSDFESAIECIFGKNGKRYRKRAGALTQEHGMRALNNLYALSCFFPKENPDKFFNVDFGSFYIPFELFTNREGWALLEHYGFNRFLKLKDSILEETKSCYIDTARMFQSLNKNYLPKKPKSIVELHNRVMELASLDQEHVNTTFLQELDFLHGRELDYGRYVIEVPRSYIDLFETGN
ncbi:MAG: hypothetical protein KC478_16880 [Bacteriovoracaceae bacterium]|nr:hypothetical protein [Bacteriovoracaceae bacterium]